MNKIEQIVLQAILEQNGLSEDEFDLNTSLSENGVGSMDIIESLIDVEDNLQVELNHLEIDVYKDNFYSLVKYVEGKL